MPRRLKLVVAYDGRPFAGWQSQAGGNTIQDLLEKAVAAVSGEHARVHGAGRTDAGVHALAQCAHVDVPNGKLSGETWASALNASLPPTIRVVRASYASAKFHARFDACGKIYRYRIWNDRVLSPLEEGRAFHVASRLRFDCIVAAANTFVGTHDFAAFAANRGKPVESTVRTIHSARVRRSGKCITLEVRGDGFLYKMVRMMAGALVRVGREQMEIEEIRERLRSGESLPGDARTVAPAGGLYLVRVLY